MTLALLGRISFIVSWDQTHLTCHTTHIASTPSPTHLTPVRPSLVRICQLNSTQLSPTQLNSFFNRTSLHSPHLSHLTSPPLSYLFAYSARDLDIAEKNLRFPMIVKHWNGYNSEGMTTKSRVANSEELRLEGVRCVESYGGALVEEFIEGQEFTVLCAENPEVGPSVVGGVDLELRLEVELEGLGQYWSFDVGSTHSVQPSQVNSFELNSGQLNSPWFRCSDSVTSNHSPTHLTLGPDSASYLALSSVRLP